MPSCTADETAKRRPSASFGLSQFDRECCEFGCAEARPHRARVHSSNVEIAPGKPDPQRPTDLEFRFDPCATKSALTDAMARACLSLEIRPSFKDVTYCAFAHGEAAGSARFITAPSPRDQGYRSRKRRGSGHQLKFSRAAA